MNKRCCLYPGSFDPVTNGHLDIIRRAARNWDRVVVGVLYNPEKQGCFPVEKRVEMLKKACRRIKNVEVVRYGGLLADLTREMDIPVVVRGVRNAADLENETAMARINGRLNPALETVLLPARAEYQEISASMVRQLALFGADLTPFVPKETLPDVLAAFDPLSSTK